MLWRNIFYMYKIHDELEKLEHTWYIYRGIDIMFYFYIITIIL